MFSFLPDTVPLLPSFLVAPSQSVTVSWPWKLTSLRTGCISPSCVQYLMYGYLHSTPSFPNPSNGSTWRAVTTKWWKFSERLHTTTKSLSRATFACRSLILCKRTHSDPGVCFNREGWLFSLWFNVLYGVQVRLCSTDFNWQQTISQVIGCIPYSF